MLVHIALPRDWELAQQSGTYTGSTLGASLAEVGFIHCSDSLEQVSRVARFLYEGIPDPILLLEIDKDALESAGLSVVHEAHSPNDPSSEKFPHVYGGPLPVTCVSQVHTYESVDALMHAAD